MMYPHNFESALLVAEGNRQIAHAFGRQCARFYAAIGRGLRTIFRHAHRVRGL